MRFGRFVRVAVVRALVAGLVWQLPQSLSQGRARIIISS